MVEENQAEQKPELSPLEQANELYKKIAEQNERLEKNIAELSTAQANALIAGTAGGSVRRLSEEEIKQQKAQQMAEEIVGAFKLNGK